MCRRCADILDTTKIVVSRLLASTRAAPCLPCQVCVAGAIAVQWRLVERTGTKNDRVELVAFDVGAAARQQKQSFAELHYVQHGGKSCAPIARLLLLTCARSCTSFDLSLEREASAIVFFLRPM